MLGSAGQRGARESPARRSQPEPVAAAGDAILSTVSPRWSGVSEVQPQSTDASPPWCLKARWDTAEAALLEWPCHLPAGKPGAGQPGTRTQGWPWLQGWQTAVSGGGKFTVEPGAFFLNKVRMYVSSAGSQFCKRDKEGSLCGTSSVGCPREWAKEASNQERKPHDLYSQMM